MIVNALGQSRDSFESIYEKTEATGQPPLTFKGTPVQYEISGNLNQDGTPTPTSPIYPQECGDKTENLFDGSYLSWGISVPTGAIGAYAGRFAFYIPVEPNTSYTISRIIGASTYFYYGFTDVVPEVGVICAPWGNIGADVTKTTITNVNHKYLVFFFGIGKSENVMLNTGSTSLPYEPYGYKLPITCGGVTQNIYLSEPLRKIGDYADEVKSDGTLTRRIKKLVLTGNEEFELHPTISNLFRAYFVTDYLFTNKTIICCSHYIGSENSISTYVLDGTTTFYYAAGRPERLIYFRDNRFATADAFKAFLAAQYAAGTPVTVWYVLDTETTETITTPTLTPTSVINTLSVGTSLVPSNVHVYGEYEIAEIYSGLNYSELIYLKTQTLTGTTPFTFKSYPGGLMNYQLSGDSYQDGVPDPEHPVEVVSVGEKTENLFDLGTIADNRYFNSDGTLNLDFLGWCVSDYIGVDTGIYTAVGIGKGTFTTYCCLYDSDKNFIGSVVNNMPVTTINVSDNCKYVRLSLRKLNDEYLTAMFVKGTTVPASYIPYGYKIPVSTLGDNLFNATISQGDISAANGTDLLNNSLCRSSYIYLDAGVYTLSASSNITYFSLRFYNKNKTYVGADGVDGNPKTFTMSISGYLRIVFVSRTGGAVIPITPSDITNVRLQKGVTDNIYLSEPLRKIGDYADEIDFKTGTVTRQIKEVVLTGAENDWLNYNESYYRPFTGIRTYARFIVAKCNAFEYHIPNIAFVPFHQFSQGAGANLLFNYDDTGSHINDFKAWLSQLYADGTPVIVYHVLSTPTTESVTLPQIPTISGQNTLTVDTTVPPSSASITGHIKPTGYGQLLDVNGVDIQDSNGTPIFIQG